MDDIVGRRSDDPTIRESGTATGSLRGCLPREGRNLMLQQVLEEIGKAGPAREKVLEYLPGRENGNRDRLLHDQSGLN